MNRRFWLIIVGILALTGCFNSFENRFDCSLKEFTLEKTQHYNILFLGTNITAQNNMPKMVSKLAKSMGDSLFYLTIAPYDYDFKRHFANNSTREIIKEIEWDYIVLQESGWRNALPPSMADTMSFCWADSLKQLIIEYNPQSQFIIFLTNGFSNGVKAIDGNWAKSDPEVATYLGMQNRIRENCFTLASELDAEIAPCGILWRICMDMDSTLELIRSDMINPTIKGSYLSACTLYCSIFRKKPESAYHPQEISMQEALFFQNSVSEALFECNPDWRNY